MPDANQLKIQLIFPQKAYRLGCALCRIVRTRHNCRPHLWKLGEYYGLVFETIWDRPKLYSLLIGYSPLGHHETQHNILWRYGYLRSVGDVPARIVLHQHYHMAVGGL